LGGDLEGALETNTMPGYAGSSWYFLRYMDPHNDQSFCNRNISDYWNQVDLYIGGTEHAVGHLLYSRMWTKTLYDLGYIGYDEPYKKLVNQGMIQGSSRFVYFMTVYYESTFGSEFRMPPILISKSFLDEDPEKTHYLKEIAQKRILNWILSSNKIDNIPQDFDFTFTSPRPVHVDVNIVDGVELNIDAFRKSKLEYRNAILICEGGEISYPSEGNSKNTVYISGMEIEKMSKSKFNTVNPDDLVIKYGADTFRMYEMFLGPVEMSKPWDTKGIEGVHRFLKKLWRLFYKESGSSQVSPLGGDLEGAVWTDEKPTDAELKVLHTTIKKIESDTERFSFNTGVSAFMIAVNELTDLKCYKKEILEPLLILLAPYAPHIAEELYHHLQTAAKVSPLGGDLEGASSILNANYPHLEEKYLVESSKEYPISINGKLRTTINIALGAAESEVEQIVLANEVIQKWLEGKPPKKIIYKEGKMVNVVV
jgi:leucyl-tRNA synthetase